MDVFMSNIKKKKGEEKNYNSFAVSMIYCEEEN